MSELRKLVDDLNQGILEGRILEVFDRYYADDVVMSENLANERVGKPACRAYEEQFLASVEFHGAELGRVIVDGDHSACEWTFDLTPKGGSRVKQSQVALQTWRDGKIVREDFYYNAG